MYFKSIPTSIHSSQYFENETNDPRQKDPIASKNIIAQNKKKKKDFTGRDLTGEKKKRNKRKSKWINRGKFHWKKSLPFLFFLLSLPSSSFIFHFHSFIFPLEPIPSQFPSSFFSLSLSPPRTYHLFSSLLFLSRAFFFFLHCTEASKLCRRVGRNNEQIRN